MTRKGIGYSELSERVYMGTIDDIKHCWVGNKIDITNNFLDTLFQYIPNNEKRIIKTGNIQSIFMNVVVDKRSINTAIICLKNILSSIKSDDTN